MKDISYITTLQALSIEGAAIRGELSSLELLAPADDAHSITLLHLSLNGCSNIRGHLSAIGSPGLKPLAAQKLFSNLLHLDLSKNAVFGNLSDICGKVPHVEHLNLAHTRLSGNLVDISLLKSLEYLNVAYTSVTGKLGLSPLRSCPKLQYLNLSETALEDVSLETLSTLKQLRELHLRGCVWLEGDISSLSTCACLEVLDLSSHKTMLLAGSLESLSWSDDQTTRVGLSRLRCLNLTNCRYIGGLMSASLVEQISAIRDTHGTDAVCLDGCGRFHLPTDLITVQAVEAATSVAASRSSIVDNTRQTPPSRARSKHSSRAISRDQNSRKSSRLSSDRTTTRSRGSIVSREAASLPVPLTLLNGRRSVINLSCIPSLEGDLMAFSKITGLCSLDLSETKVGGYLSSLQDCRLLEALDLSRRPKFMYGAVQTESTRRSKEIEANARGDEPINKKETTSTSLTIIIGDLSSLPQRCPQLSSLKLRNCWRLAGDCTEDIRYSLAAPPKVIEDGPWSFGGNLRYLDLHGTQFVWPKGTPKGNSRTYDEKACILLGTHLRGEPPPPEESNDEEEEEEEIKLKDPSILNPELVRSC